MSCLGKPINCGLTGADARFRSVDEPVSRSAWFFKSQRYIFFFDYQTFEQKIIKIFSFAGASLVFSGSYDWVGEEMRKKE